VESPATDRTGWPGTGWLRVAVPAGIAGGLAAAAWNALLGEPVLGKAIRLEESSRVHLHLAALAEPFTRREQQGGMVLGAVLLGCAVGLLIVGAALLAGPAFLGPVRRAWPALVAAGTWSFLVLPTVKYPALPPGAESSLPIDTRQWSYVVLVCSGVLGAVLARLVWLRLSGRRRAAIVALASLAFAAPALVALAFLPAEHTVTSIDHGLLTRFRLAAISSQAAFWALTALAGFWFLDHRPGAAVRSARALLRRRAGSAGYTRRQL
jgi:hypothetical protein